MYMCVCSCVGVCSITVEQDCAASIYIYVYVYVCAHVLEYARSQLNKTMQQAYIHIYICICVCSCVGVCSITVEQDYAASICEGVLKTVANSNADLGMAQRGRLFVQEKKNWVTKNIRRDCRAYLYKKSCKAKTNRYEEQVWKP